MQKILKNRLFEIVKDSGLSLSYIEGIDKGDRFRVDILEIFSFTFEVYQNSKKLFICEYTEIAWGGTAHVDLWQSESQYEDFDDVCKCFKRWLGWAKSYLEERDAPDLWADFEQYETYANALNITEPDYQPFTEREKEQVRVSLLEFRRLVIETFDPTPDQTAFITERLNYLTEAVDRLNKFDWKGVALNIVISIAITLTLDTQKGQLLFQLFQQAFDSTLKLLMQGHP